MCKGILLKNHFSLNSANEVDEICAPLKEIGVTYFNYIKIHSDGSRELLTNNAAWIEHFYKQALFYSTAVIDIEHLLPKGYFLWSELNSDDPVYVQGRETFNIDNGITFVMKRDSVTYLYIFATTRDQYTINNFYLRNIDLFKRFILYFNDKASSLITKAAENRIYLPNQQIIRPERIKKQGVSFREKQEFYEKTKIERFYLLPVSNELYLTQKQAECAALLVNGATAKKCAKILGISHRTAEHYISEIKQKMQEATGQYLSKEGLIASLKRLGICDAVFPDKSL